MNKIKRYAPFAIAAVLGGVLLKVASKQVLNMMPKMMEGMMGEGGPMDM